MPNYVVSGFSAPAGINSKDAVKELQKQLNAKGAGLVVDGIWGSKTEAAYKSSMSSKTDPYYNSQAARVAQTYYAPMSVPKTQSATVSKTPKYAIDIDSRAKAFVARTLERLGKSTTKKDEAEYQFPQTSKVLTLPYNKIAVDSKPTIKNMPATAQDTPNVVHTFPKTEQPRSSVLPAVWEIELGNALKKYVQQHPQASADKAVTANYGMGASSNKSLSQQKRDNQIKEEKIIADIRGATSYKISSSTSSQDKLYDIIDRSFPLADRLRIRAKQAVEGLSKEAQDELLLDVMLDGPNAYFSREANEQRAYNTFFGREDVRLYPNATLPGEGIARQEYDHVMTLGFAPDKDKHAAQSTAANDESTRPMTIPSASTDSDVISGERTYEDVSTELRELLMFVDSVPSWEKSNALGASGSGIYNDALQRIKELEKEIKFYDEYWEQQTEEEYEAQRKEHWLAMQNPRQGITAAISARKALRATTAKYGTRDKSDGTITNAFQHAYWNALMTINMGEDNAKMFADAHEVMPLREKSKISYGFTGAQHTEMDLFFNELGRKVAIDLLNEYSKVANAGFRVGGATQIIPPNILIERIEEEIEKNLDQVLRK